jgi:hypothetical protein
MTHEDERLDEELARARETWRTTPEPPLDAMWREIEARSFPAGGSRKSAPRLPHRRWLPMAAMLVLGVALGQLVPRPGVAPSVPGASDGPAASPDQAVHRSVEPFVGIAAGYLERVTALLVTLASETEQHRPLDNTRAQARELLATTRLLLDDSAALDPTTAVLLDDLELVLVQIARLPNRPSEPDVYLIDQALGEREVMPRLRTLLASAHDTRPY